MGFFTTIKNFFSVTPKLAENVFDKDSGLLVRAGGFIDGLSYTDQEKAENKAVLVQNVLDFVKMTLGESTIRSTTRRAIAIMWIKVQLGLILVTGASIPVDVYFKTKLTKEFFALATSDVMAIGTTAVIIFFFGAYAIGTHIMQAKK